MIRRKRNVDLSRVQTIPVKLMKKEELHLLGLTILQKEPQYRTRRDIEVLETMTAGNQFISKIETEHGLKFKLELLRYIYMEFVGKGEVLFELGQIGLEFYIIMNGSVALLQFRLSPALLSNSHKRL